MRALLVVNPQATSTSALVRDVIAQALAGQVKVDVAVTDHRGHAASLARCAAREGYGAVVVHGGDGTVNEVVNGLMSSSDPAAPAAERPALAIVPGGSTNVFARGAGYPSDPIEATGSILDALRNGRRRRVGLGQAGDRWFTFCAGIGYDADVIARVEEHRAAGHRSTHALYVRSALMVFFRNLDRSDPALTVSLPGEEPIDGVHLAIICNTSPWTFLGNRPLQPCPEASFDSGLDLLAPRKLTVATTLRHVAQLMSTSPRMRGRHLVTRHDLKELTLTSSRPLSFQVDGDYLGDIDRLTLRSVPEALDVVV